MRKAVGYVRVSTRHQETQGCGLLAQEAAIKAFAKSEGYELISIEKDVGTARGSESISQRHGLRSAIRMAQQTGATILVWNASRVSRDFESFSKLMNVSMPRIVEINANNQSGSSGLAANVARAEVEADHLMKRTTAGMRRAKKNGVKFGNPVNLSEAREKGVLENIRRADDFSASISRVISGHRASGISTAAGIAAALNADGHLSPYGKPWTKENIRNTLKRIENLENQALTDMLENSEFDYSQLPASFEKIGS
jgi:DNA invertase Pin-like site-specific DNA recombinase